jgi:hypothetical protein
MKQMQWKVEGTITVGVGWRKHGGNINRRYLQHTQRRTLGTNFSVTRLTQSQESTPKKVSGLERGTEGSNAGVII